MLSQVSPKILTTNRNVETIHIIDNKIIAIDQASDLTCDPLKKGVQARDIIYNWIPSDKNTTTNSIRDI